MWQRVRVCVTAVVRFYRLDAWQAKVSGMRPLLYTGLGYAMAGGGSFALMLANGLAVAGLLMYFGAYGNYWDWRLYGERNGTAWVIERYRLAARTALLLSVAPWLGIVPLLGGSVRLGMSVPALGLFGVVAAVGTAYISPGIRLKVRRGGFLLTPTVACLLFLQAYGLEGKALGAAPVLVLCGVLWLFQCQAELLHLIDDYTHASQEPQAAGPATLLRWLRRLPTVAFWGSLAAASVSPWFLNSTIWSAMRHRALRGLSVEDVSRVRQELWRPHWSLPEFAVYGLLGCLGRFA